VVHGYARLLQRHNSKSLFVIVVLCRKTTTA
jgi:hypothetical protein